MQSLTLTLIMGALIGQTSVDQSSALPTDPAQEVVVSENAAPQATETVYTTQVCAPAVHETIGSKIRVAASGACDYLRDSVGPMPQSAYGPGYGCYPGANNRYMHRYPAFHGYYNANPNNFRHLYEYPWNATPVQPSPMYTATVTDSQAIAAQASNDTIITPVERKYRKNLHQPNQTVLVPVSTQMIPSGAQGVPTPAAAPSQSPSQDPATLETLPSPQEIEVPVANPVTKNSAVKNWQDDSVVMPVRKTIKKAQPTPAKQANLDKMYK